MINEAVGWLQLVLFYLRHRKLLFVQARLIATLTPYRVAKDIAVPATRIGSTLLTDCLVPKVVSISQLFEPAPTRQLLMVDMFNAVGNTATELIDDDEGCNAKPHTVRGSLQIESPRSRFET